MGIKWSVSKVVKFGCVGAVLCVIAAVVCAIVCTVSYRNAVRDVVGNFSVNEVSLALSSAMSTGSVEVLRTDAVYEEHTFCYEPAVASLIEGLISEYYDPNAVVPLNVDVSALSEAAVLVADVEAGVAEGKHLDELLLPYWTLVWSPLPSDDALDMHDMEVAGLVLAYDYGVPSDYVNIVHGTPCTDAFLEDGVLYYRASDLSFDKGIAYVGYQGFVFPVYSTVSGVALSVDDIPHWGCVFMDSVQVSKRVPEGCEGLLMGEFDEYSTVGFRFSDGGGNFHEFRVLVGYGFKKDIPFGVGVQVVEGVV